MKATIGILLITAAGFAVGVAVYFSNPYLLPYLVLYNKAVLSGYYYELVTGMLVTPSLADFLLNAVSLYAIYVIFGGEAGRYEYAVFFASGILGNVLTVLLYPPNIMSAGASGGIFGLLSFYVARGMALSRDFSWVGPALLAAVFLASSILPNVNYVAHVGGIIGGVVMGLLEPRRLSRG
ncbi:MAG: rhomboid family intramembrane serine protease [Thermoproteus sp.]